MYLFDKTAKGGWIIPDGTVFDNKVKIPPFSVIGNNCVFKDTWIIGHSAVIGDDCSFGYFGDWSQNPIKPFRVDDTAHWNSELGHSSTVGSRCKFENNSRIGYNCIIGNSAIFGSFVQLSYDCTVGDEAVFGNYVRIGNRAIIGKSFTFGDWCGIVRTHNTEQLPFLNGAKSVEKNCYIETTFRTYF